MGKFYTPVFYCLFAFIFGWNIQKTKGQNLPSDVSAQIQKLTPKPAQNSPNAAAIQKYGDYNVNLYTGIPDISIPLYEIEAGPIRVPIVLTYHPGGNRYTDRASWAGLGWSVQVGGQVTRSIIGKPDEMGFISLINNYGVDPFDFCNNINYKELTASGANDREPDLFSYSYPGGSGRFLLRQGGQPPLLFPESAIRLVRNPNFYDITDTNGLQYRFGSDWAGANGARESMSSNSGSSVTSGIVTWHLQEIKSQNSDDYVTFKFQNVGSILSSEIESNITLMDECNSGATGLLPCDSYLPVTTLVSTSSSTTQLGIEEIFFKTGKVKFVLGSVRTDLPTSPNVARLARIEIYSKLNGLYTLEKSFVLMNSGNFKIISNNADARLKLDGLQVRDAANTVINSYSFTYQTDTFSWDAVAGSYRRDLFGFYNGKTANTNLIPQETVQYQANSALPVTTISVGGADRSTDTTFYKEGMLKRITFPTGGYTEFQFEPHKYSDAGVTKYGSGLRIKRITKNDGTTSYFTLYNYGNSEDGFGYKNFDVRNFHFLNTQYKRDVVPGMPNQRQFRVRSWISNSVVGAGFDDSPVVYSKVTELVNGTNANGKTIYEFDNNTLIPDGVFTVPYSNKTWRNKKSWERGKLTKVTKLDNANNIKEITTKTYTKYKSQSLNVGQAATQVIIGEEAGNFFISCPGAGGGSPFDGMRFMIARITQDAGVYLETGSTQTLFYGTDSIRNSIIRGYNPTFLRQTFDEKSTSPNPEFIRNETRYNFDLINLTTTYSGRPEALRQLLLRNILVPIEQYTIVRQPNLTNVVTSGQVTEYALVTGTTLYLPAQIYFLETLNPLAVSAYLPVALSGTSALNRDTRYRLRMTMSTYDTRGNLLQYLMSNGLTNSFIYGYEGSYVVGEATNSPATQIAYTSFETIEKGGWTYSGAESNVMLGQAKTGNRVYLLNNGAISKTGLSSSNKLSFWVRRNTTAAATMTISGTNYTGAIDDTWRLVEVNSTSSISISGSNTIIDELRVHPLASQMKTYTHKPLIGMWTLLDQNNTGIFYHYDPFGRLETIKNDWGHILKHYEYAYIKP
jgi:hypothetical protein